MVAHRVRSDEVPDNLLGFIPVDGGKKGSARKDIENGKKRDRASKAEDKGKLQEPLDREPHHVIDEWTVSKVPHAGHEGRDAEAKIEVEGQVTEQDKATTEQSKPTSSRSMTDGIATSPESAKWSTH